MTAPFRLERLEQPITRMVLDQKTDSEYGMVISRQLARNFRLVGAEITRLLGSHSMLRADVVVDAHGNCHIVEINTYGLGGGCWYDLVCEQAGFYNGLPRHIDLLRRLALAGMRYVITPHEAESVDFRAHGLFIPVVDLDRALREMHTYKKHSCLAVWHDEELGQLGDRLLWSPAELRANERKDKLISLSACSTLFVPTDRATRVPVSAKGYVYKMIRGSGGREVSHVHPSLCSENPKNWVAQRRVDTYIDNGFHAVFGVYANGAVWPKIKNDWVVGAKTDGSCWTPILRVE